MGIDSKKGFIKREALRLLRTNSVREDFEQSKRDVQEILTEVKFTDRNDALRSKTNTRYFTVCHYLQYLQSGQTESQKDSHETLGHHSTVTQAQTISLTSH